MIHSGQPQETPEPVSWHRVNKTVGAALSSAASPGTGSHAACKSIPILGRRIQEKGFLKRVTFSKTNILLTWLSLGSWGHGSTILASGPRRPAAEAARLILANHQKGYWLRDSSFKAIAPPSRPSPHPHRRSPVGKVPS